MLILYVHSFVYGLSLKIRVKCSITKLDCETGWTAQPAVGETTKQTFIKRVCHPHVSHKYSEASVRVNKPLFPAVSKNLLPKPVRHKQHTASTSGWTVTLLAKRRENCKGNTSSESECRQSIFSLQSKSNKFGLPGTRMLMRQSRKQLAKKQFMVGFTGGFQVVQFSHQLC